MTAGARNALLCVACGAAGIVVGRWLLPAAADRVAAVADAGTGGQAGPDLAGGGAALEKRVLRGAGGVPVTEEEAARVAARLGPEAVRDLIRRVQTAESELADLRDRVAKGGPRMRYDAPTAQGRRKLAAKAGRLLLEVPATNDRAQLSDDVLERAGLDEDGRRDLQQTFGDFQGAVTSGLQKVFADVAGDPEAGRGASIDTLIHGITEMSPGAECRVTMRSVVDALAKGGQLPTGAGPCGEAAALVIRAVDAFEQAVAAHLGDAGVKALWSNASSFEFSTSQTPPGGP